MKPLSRLLSIVLGVGAVATSPAVAATDLPTAMKSGFFQFFNLEASCPLVAGDNGTHWQCFRPSGPKFRALVELDVQTDAQGVIVASQLGIDRGFIDSPRDGVFARDIAKSYLGWATPSSPGDIAILAYNIGDMSQAGGQIIMHQDAAASVPPDTTGGYAVYLGKTEKVALKGPGFTLDLANISGALPAEHIFAPAAAADPTKRWLRLAVRLSGK